MNYVMLCYYVKLLYGNGWNDWEKNCTKCYGMVNCDLNWDVLSFVNDWMHHWLTLLCCLFRFDCATYDLLFTFSKWILHSSFSVQYFNLLEFCLKITLLKTKERYGADCGVLFIVSWSEKEKFVSCYFYVISYFFNQWKIWETFQFDFISLLILMFKT